MAPQLWVALVEAGVHPTIAGVAIGLLHRRVPAAARARTNGRRAGEGFREARAEYARSTKLSFGNAVSPNERLEDCSTPGRAS